MMSSMQGDQMLDVMTLCRHFMYLALVVHPQLLVHHQYLLAGIYVEHPCNLDPCSNVPAEAS